MSRTITAPGAGLRRARRPGIVAALVLAGAAAATLLAAPASPALTIPQAELRDRIQGAWVGGIAAAAWGEPTEFRFNGRMVPRRLIPRFSMRSANAYTFRERGGPDETYVELPFLEALRRDVQAGSTPSPTTSTPRSSPTSPAWSRRGNRARRSTSPGAPVMS